MSKTNKTQNEKMATTAKTENEKMVKTVNEISQQLTNDFEKNGKCLIGLDKITRKQMVKDNMGNVPNWVERPSDIPTYFCQKMATGYKIPENEKYRATNGNVYLTFDGKYWKCNVNIIEGNENREIITNDLLALEQNGTSYYNVSNISSERRHVESIAKFIALYYKLAFSPIIDIPNIDMKDLQKKERRVEIYKYMSKMVNDTNESK